MDQGLDTVMIVDNSADQKANIQLQEALEEFRLTNPPFSMHQMINQKNLGYAAGVNNALRWLEANYPHSYYLLINNDAEATPGMVLELLKFICKDDRTVLTAPVIDTGHKQIVYTWYHRFTGLMFLHHIIGTFPYLSGCCLLIDRRIIGDRLFDEVFFMYGEDVALCWRIRCAGYNTVCVSDATVRHKGAGSSHYGGFFYEYHTARAHILLAGKLARYRWEMPILLFGRLLTISVRAILRALHFRSMVPIKAGLNAVCKHDVSSAYK